MIAVYEEVAAAYEAQAAANAKLAAAFRSLSQADATITLTRKKKDTPPPAQKAEPEKPPVTFEKVRAALAKKSVEGYTDEVRALIAKYGVKKLSDLGSESYESVLKEAEDIGNGK